MAFDYSPLINGSNFSWSSIQILIANVPILGVTAIRYDANRETTQNYAVGGNPISRSYNNISRSGMIRMYREELDALSDASISGNLYDIPPFDIIVQFEESGVFRTHKLLNVVFLGNGVDVVQNSSTIESEIELSIGNIDWKGI